MNFEAPIWIKVITTGGNLELYLVYSKKIWVVIVRNKQRIIFNTCINCWYKIITAKQPDDFILATGKSHSIKEFCELTAKILEIDLIWEGKGSETKGINRKNGSVIIEMDKTFYRPADVDYLIGNAKKANTELNWFPKTELKKLIEIMVNFEVTLHKK